MTSIKYFALVFLFKSDSTLAFRGLPPSQPSTASVPPATKNELLLIDTHIAARKRSTDRVLDPMELMAANMAIVDPKFLERNGVPHPSILSVPHAAKNHRTRFNQSNRTKNPSSKAIDPLELMAAHMAIVDPKVLQ